MGTQSEAAAAYSLLRKKHNFQFPLKDAQVECLNALLKGKDVFALLPTRYGKSMIYSLFPLIMQQVQITEHKIYFIKIYYVTKKSYDSSLVHYVEQKLCSDGQLFKIIIYD